MSKSNQDLIRVRSCKLDWIIRPQLYQTRSTISSSLFCASDDKNLYWILKLQRDMYWNGNLSSPCVMVKSYHSSLDSKEVWNRGSIAGKATIKIKPLNSKGETKDCESSFVSIEKELQISGRGSEHLIGRYDETIHNDCSQYDMEITCEVSYFYLNDAVPILISDRYIICPAEKYQFIQAADRGVFQEMYLNEKYSDVVLCVNGSDCPAHKIVLAAHSKVFKAMFEQENQLDLVEIEHIDESAFLQALRFMYFGRVEDVQTLAYDLLPMADRYGIEELKTACENILMGTQISVETVVRILLLTESYKNVEDLKKQAIDFFASNSKAVVEQMSSKEWDALMSRPSLMKELLFSSCINK